MRVLAVALLAGAISACAGGATLDEGVRSDSSAYLQPGDDLFVVQFTDEADLSGVEEIADWDERGQEVVRRLQEKAAASQAEAIAAATEADARFVSLWISNSLVFAGTEALGNELAQLPGVMKVWKEDVPEGIDDPESSSAPFPEPGDGGWEV
ncbi:MAG: hypothetical protein ACOYNJ_02370, partial [Candidatus Nanopelagicales bacterium]